MVCPFQTAKLTVRSPAPAATSDSGPDAGEAAAGGFGVSAAGF